jgi:hypothetical protein
MQIAGCEARRVQLKRANSGERALIRRVPPDAKHNLDPTFTCSIVNTSTSDNKLHA